MWGLWVFQGRSALSMDAKGRVSIPTRYRDALVSSAEGRLTLTRHPDGCLLLYPRPVWERKREQIAAFPMAARALQRLLLGSAQDVELDSAGRILVAPELREAADLTREAMMLGLGEHFELWDAETLKRREAEALEQVLAEPLADFSF